MGFLADKRILITGLISNRSIAYGIAQACRREGATLAFTYQSERIRSRVIELAKDFGSNLIFPCDVSDDQQIESLFTELGSHWDGLEGLVHSIAYAPREALEGDYVTSVTRESFRIAHEISSYSFTALAKAGRKMLANRNASLLTLSYLGAARPVPNYNVMGLAKASLEANVRYMAQSLGAENIRVNGISAGPIKTLAASGISDFGKILDYVAHNAPLKRNVTQEEVGNAAAFLLSNLASAITGEITYVDSGFNITSLGENP
jgi:enoyl-[acyl-carrier protein] reductase I